MNQNYQVQMVTPLTPMVKYLLIANVGLWVVLILILQQFFMQGAPINMIFGLVPAKVGLDFWIWQPFTYMFLHSRSVFHILFNMLMLWFIGSELEARWGSRFFLLYYMVTGVGAALIYLVGVFLVALFQTDSIGVLGVPVVGASGAIFGLFLAYGIIFGERVIYFMMMFPMKAKYFVMILGLIEVLTLLNSGVGGGVANLAHLGGIAAGYLFLISWTRWKGRLVRTRTKRRGRKLRLVVNNEDEASDKTGPRYWN